MMRFHVALVLVSVIACCVQAKSLQDAAGADLEKDEVELARRALSLPYDPPFTCLKIYLDYTLKRRKKDPTYMHSACAEPNPLLQSPKDYLVPLKDQEVITNLHNKLRGAYTPSAADVRKLYWSKQLQYSAQGRANTLPAGHDKVKMRIVPGRFSAVGQNYVRPATSWTNAIYSWYDENKDFDYGIGIKAGHPKSALIGHFTQLMWNSTFLFGCGKAVRKVVPPSTIAMSYWICNYAPGGNRKGSLNYPFQQGPNGAWCVQKVAPDGTCDCARTECRRATSKPDTPNEKCACTCIVGWHGPECRDPDQDLN